MLTTPMRQGSLKKTERCNPDENNNSSRKYASQNNNTWAIFTKQINKTIRQKMHTVKGALIRRGPYAMA
jgi:hypothetical protein